MPTTHLGQSYTDFQGNHYQSKNPTRRWLHGIRGKWIQTTIAELPKPEKRCPQIFEAGIGCGLYTRWLATQGEVFAIDINPDFVDAAHEIDGVVARVADITFEGGAEMHDIALCADVLQQVNDTQAALRQLYFSLSPGGVLVLTTQNAYSTVELAARLLSFKPMKKLAQFIYQEPVSDLGHINRMTRSQLLKEILRTGFEVIRQDNLGFYLPFVSEFGGKAGLWLCQWIARRLEGSRLSWMLWTQCWVLRRPLAQNP
jgi:2-polyprenyl-3-methyl-5-hydroxy-6-metoxy-1,4-benzoquinol methylase